MATQTYDTDWGYAAWHAWRDWTGESGIQFGEFSPFGDSLVRPIGLLKWRGRFTTPTYGPRQTVLITVIDFMDALAASVDDLEIPIPEDQRFVGSSLPAVMRVQPMSITPGARGNNGVTTGYTVEWVEYT